MAGVLQLFDLAQSLQSAQYGINPQPEHANAIGDHSERLRKIVDHQRVQSLQLDRRRHFWPRRGLLQPGSEPEPAALPRSTVDADLSAHQVREMPCQGQS